MKNYFVALLAPLLVSCSSITLCEKDSFFCQPRNQWVASASKLPTDRVYKLHTDLQSFYRPGDYELLHVLGKRGGEAVDAMITDINNRKSSAFNDITAVLTAVRVGSGYNICADRRRQTLLNNAINSNNRVNTSIVRNFCQI